MRDYPGVVRNAPLRIVGRVSPEGALLPMIREELWRQVQNEPLRAQVLECPGSGAVAGFTVWDWLWPGTCLLDVYCHPSFWAHISVPRLFPYLPKADRYVAYADLLCESKIRVLEQNGFHVHTSVPNWLAVDSAKTKFADLLIFELDKTFCPDVFGGDE
jgi:hypothetical protein